MKQPPIARHSPLTSTTVNVVQPVVVGRLGQVYGIKGWLKLQSFTSPETNIIDYKPWYLATAKGYLPVTFDQFKEYGKGFIVHIENCDDRTLAQSYTNLDVVIAKEQLPVLDEDEYYLIDLEGMTVVNQQGIVLGTVSHLMQTAGTETLVVDGQDRQRLIPYVMDHFILRVDQQQRQILVDWDPEF